MVVELVVLLLDGFDAIEYGEERLLQRLRVPGTWSVRVNIKCGLANPNVPPQLFPSDFAKLLYVLASPPRAHGPHVVALEIRHNGAIIERAVVRNYLPTAHARREMRPHGYGRVNLCLIFIGER